MQKLLSVIISLCVANVVYAEDDITVVALNDFHGQVQANKNMVGAAKIATYLKNFKQQYPNTIVVLAGDNYQGTAISNLSYGQVDNDFFNYIGVKYSAIGNHEFDYGQSAFESWTKTANFKFLAANIIESTTGGVFKYAEPYGQYTLPSGKKIALIGLATLETPETTASYNINNLNFIDPVKASNKWVEYLNSSKNPNGKPDTIALLTHIPSEQESDGNIIGEVRPELNTSEIDYVSKNSYDISAILSGHSHKLVSGFINGIAVVQGASQGKDLSVLHYDCHTTKKCIVTPEVINLADVTNSLQADPVVESIINHYLDKNKQVLNQVIVNSAESLSNMPESGNYNIKLTYTIANIMRNLNHSDIGLQNTYGIRRSLPAGNITYGMIYETMPFDNTVTTLNIKGSDLLVLIKHSLPLGRTQIGVFAGVKIVLGKNNTINKVYINGKLLDNNKIYRLATINFLVSGGDGFDFSKATDITDTNIPIRNVIRDEWQRNGIHVPNNWQSVSN